MLTTIADVLTPDELRLFRSRLDAADWQDGARTAGTLARSAKRNLQLDDASELARGLGNHILRKLGADPRFIAAALPSRIFPPRFNRYADGGTYDHHIDSAVMHVPGSSVTVRSDLSATLFLCKPEEYDGGVLEIEHASGTQCIKLNAGSLVLYPSSSLHRVTPVTRGARIASFFWIESLVADEGQRTLLYTLDQSIQGLTPAVSPSDPHLIRLTGVYHNLLRRWAVT
jgi:PKHD-type hydroxylase